MVNTSKVLISIFLNPSIVVIVLRLYDNYNFKFPKFYPKTDLLLDDDAKASIPRHAEEKNRDVSRVIL